MAELQAIFGSYPIVPDQRLAEQVNVFAFIPPFRSPRDPLRSVSTIVDAHPLIPEQTVPAPAPFARSVEQIIADFPIVHEVSTAQAAPQVAATSEPVVSAKPLGKNQRSEKVRPRLPRPISERAPTLRSAVPHDLEVPMPSCWSLAQRANAPAQDAVPLPSFVPVKTPRSRPSLASSPLVGSSQDQPKAEVGPIPAARSGSIANQALPKQRPLSSQIPGATAKSARAASLLPLGQTFATWTRALPKSC